MRLRPSPGSTSAWASATISSGVGRDIGGGFPAPQTVRVPANWNRVLRHAPTIALQQFFFLVRRIGGTRSAFKGHAAFFEQHGEGRLEDLVRALELIARTCNWSRTRPRSDSAVADACRNCSSVSDFGARRRPLLRLLGGAPGPQVASFQARRSTYRLSSKRSFFRRPRHL